MKYTIDRSTWLRGEMGGSFLLRPSDGKMCCLGHVALQCGLTADEIMGREAPQIVEGDGFKKFPSWLLDFQNPHGLDTSDEGFMAMKANDREDLTDEEREETLKIIFARNGDELEFVN